MFRLSLRRFAGDQAGASLVETALVMPLFLGVLLSTIEVGVLGMVSAGFNNAMLVASRKIRTGQSDMPATAKAFKAAICANMSGTDCGQRVNVTVQTYGPGASAFGAAAAGYPGAARDPAQPLPDPADGRYAAGTANDVVLVTATYRWPLATPFLGAVFPRTGAGEVLITSRQLFKAEPYL